MSKQHYISVAHVNAFVFGVPFYVKLRILKGGAGGGGGGGGTELQKGRKRGRKKRRKKNVEKSHFSPEIHLQVFIAFDFTAVLLLSEPFIFAHRKHCPAPLCPPIFTSCAASLFFFLLFPLSFFLKINFTSAQAASITYNYDARLLFNASSRSPFFGVPTIALAL